MNILLFIENKQDNAKKYEVLDTIIDMNIFIYGDKYQ